jgi:hypothetical protein
MKTPYFFGYGSLVNRATHSYPGASPATAKGWRRRWCHTALRPVAFLTAVPDPQGEIDGLMAAVPGADWQALDQREYAYERIATHTTVTHALDHQPEIALYAVPLATRSDPSLRHPVLLSYLDVVVQGYLAEFGAAGAQRFFATTDGWDAPILNDRHAPLYPRHQSLTRSEQQVVDDQLAALCVRIHPLK